MLLTRILKAVHRYYISKSGSMLKVQYFRKQGMKIGDNCQIDIMEFSTEPYLIEIGEHVGISQGTVFVTHDAGIRCFREEFPDDDIFGEIKLGDNVFVGANCTFLPNTFIGNNCIIGAGSVVRGRFPDNSVIVGNPARVLTNINVQKLLYGQNPGRLKTANMTDEKKKPVVLKHFKK